VKVNCVSSWLCLLRNYFRSFHQPESLNLKVNEDIIQITYLSRGHGPGMTHLTLIGRKIPFVNQEMCLSVLSLTNITWRTHTETKQVKAFSVFEISSYQLSVA
jgi:hypothetical protein